MISGNTAHIQKSFPGRTLIHVAIKKRMDGCSAALIEKSLSLRRLITIRLLRKVLNGGAHGGQFHLGADSWTSVPSC